jgi:hypothetical protein
MCSYTTHCTASTIYGICACYTMQIGVNANASYFATFCFWQLQSSSLFDITSNLENRTSVLDNFDLSQLETAVKQAVVEYKKLEQTRRDGQQSHHSMRSLQVSKLITHSSAFKRMHMHTYTHISNCYTIILAYAVREFRLMKYTMQCNNGMVSVKKYQCCSNGWRHYNNFIYKVQTSIRDF